MDLTHCRLTVVAKKYWRAYSQQKKLVEFRSGNQSIALTEGMQLLFSLNASERMRGNTDLVCAEVLKVIRLTCEQACARFPAEAHACNLPQLCTTWHTNTVNCILVKKNSLHQTNRLVNLAQGNQGILKQFIDTTGAPRFCHIDDLDRTLTVTNNAGKTETCSFHATWPAASNTRRASTSALAGASPARDNTAPLQTRTNPSDADCTPSVTLKLQPFSYLIDSDRKLQWLQDYLSYTEKLNLSLKSLENECDLGIGDLREIITLVLQRPVIRPSLLRNKMNRHIEVNMGDSISSSTLHRWSKGDVREHHASDKKRFIRTVLKIVKFVADEVVASFMLNCYTDEVESFRKTFRSWVLETFRPQCKRVLPSILYDGNHWSGDHNPLEDAITNYYLETVRVDPETTSLGSLEWCDKCHVAFNDPVTPLKCSGCGIKRCEECFGVKIGKEHKQRGRGHIVQLKTRPFVCEWCLCEWRLHNSSEAKLLQPDPSVKLCFLCGCDLISREWAACPARCKLCFRLYCERDAAVCSNDFKVAPSSLEVLGIQNKKGGRSVKSPKSESGPRVSSAAVSKEEPLESLRTVSLITCLSCVGRPAFLEDRRQAFRRLAKSISLEVRDPLAPANEYKLLRSDVKTNGAAANAVGDFVYDLHWAGFREVSNAALGFLMKILSLQVSPEATHCTLRPCVSPFNMLRLLDNHSYASSVMLEKVCLAHAEWAAKDGEDLLKKVKGLPPLKDVAEKNPNVYKVGFYGGNLFKNGPLVDLVADAIIQFSKRVKFDVFVFGVGSDYKNDGSYIHPPVKQLWDNFDQDRRICFKESDDSAGKLKKFREPQLDVFISLPGWTGVDTDLGEILHCRVAPLQFNWLEFAGVMHAPNLVDFTLLGPAVGQEQRDSDSRERIAEFDAPDSYQPPQSNALTVAVLERQKTQSPKDRAYWGIPAENFVLLVPGSTDRLCEETIYMFFELLLRLPELIVIFLDRPAPMRSFILEKLAEFNRAQDTDSKTGPKVDQSRLIFQAWIHDKCDFWEFIDAVGHEEGGGGIHLLAWRVHVSYRHQRCNDEASSAFHLEG